MTQHSSFPNLKAVFNASRPVQLLKQSKDISFYFWSWLYQTLLLTFFSLRGLSHLSQMHTIVGSSEGKTGHTARRIGLFQYSGTDEAYQALQGPILTHMTAYLCLSYVIAP